MHVAEISSQLALVSSHVLCDMRKILCLFIIHHVQVVAGVNYKLELQTSDGKYSADVFKGLGDGGHELKGHQKL